MKKIVCSLILLFALFLLAFPVYAADNTTICIDSESSATVVDTQIVNGVTFVPVRVVSEKLGAAVEYVSASNEVWISSFDANGSRIKLPIGKKTATLEQNGQKQSLALNIAPYKSNGTTYVPLRFASEILGYTVYWDKATHTTIVYRRNAQSEATLQGADLAAARNAAIDLPHIDLMEKLTTSQENISSKTYIFPYGESKRFAEQTNDIIKYYAVRDGAAWLLWQGKIGTDDKTQGERPSFGNKQVYFNDYFQADSIIYGVIENGTMQQIEEIKNISAQSPGGDWKNRVIIHSIEEETKID